jgi:indolepyruvate decarboxylase
MAGLFHLINGMLDDKTLVIADVGESLFASADLRVHDAAEFLSPAYYTSMGFGLPAALGAGIAAPHLRPLVLVGDGAFQMTGTELSTCVRYGLRPIVVVLNNHGYSTERAILEGTFNDIACWNYERICDLIGSGVPHVATTHTEAAEALAAAAADPARAHVINVHLDPNDRSPAMQRVASRLAARIAAKA